MDKKVVIITGGDCRTSGIDKDIFPDSYVIAADSGYETAVKLGIKPDLLVGDFDSLKAKVKDESIPVVRVRPEKDDTDTMLAISKALEKGATDIYIVGGAGGRADHWLSNIFMLEYLIDNGVRGVLTDGINTIRIIEDTEFEIPRTDGYFGIIALEDSTLSITGSKYDVSDIRLKRNFPFAVSNEVTADKAKISLKGKAIFTESIKQ